MQVSRLTKNAGLSMAAVMAGLFLGFNAGVMGATEEGEPIKIGALFAISGPASFLGAPEAKTVEMIAEQINAKGGIKGRPLQLIIKDTEASPEKAVSFTKQLIEEDEVVAIIGPTTSGETMQIKALCEAEEVPLVSCAAAEVIVNPVARYVFKTPQKDSQAITWIFNTMKKMGIKRIAVLSSNTGFGQAGKTQLESMAGDAGLEIGINEVYDKKASDLTDILTKVKGANVDAIVNWSIEPAQSILAKNMKQIGLDIPLFQSHGFGNILYVEQAGKAAEGILFPAGRLLVADQLPDDHPQKALLVEYKTAYEDRYGEAVSTFGGHAYDALLMVTEGLKRADTIDRDSLRDAIEGLTGLVGTAGIFNLSATDHTGLDLDAFEMLTVKDGRFTQYQAE